MEIKIDRYTKIVLMLTAVGLFFNAFKSEIASVGSPEPAYAENIGMGNTLTSGTQSGQRFVTASPDGKTVYYWFREEDKQWYDWDKIIYLGSKMAKD